MKFKINKDVLLENLNNVGRALSNRNIIPIINHMANVFNPFFIYYLLF